MEGAVTEEDEICSICHEPKSAHVLTDEGPFTHPREARGEGEYVLVYPAHTEGTFFPGYDDREVPAVWKFVAKTMTKTAKKATTKTAKKG